MNDVDSETGRLLLNVMLGTLAVYLPLCGYDAADVGDRGLEADCWRCRDCGRASWKGSHWDRMRESLE